jgi:hypothetical protein
VAYFLDFIATWQNIDFRARIAIFTEIFRKHLLAGMHDNAPNGIKIY